MRRTRAPSSGGGQGRRLYLERCPAETSADVAAMITNIGLKRAYVLTPSYWHNGVPVAWPDGPGTYEGLNETFLLDKVTNGFGGGCGSGGLEPIPLDFTGFVTIDVENPAFGNYEQALYGQGGYSMADTGVSANIYLDVFQAVRAILPKAILGSFGLATTIGPFDAGYDPARWDIITTLHSFLDCADPPVWRRNGVSFGDDTLVAQRRLNDSFDVAQANQIKVIPWASIYLNGALGQPLHTDIETPEIIRDWYDQWSAYAIHGYAPLHGEEDLVIPPILRASLDETPITLP